MLMQSNKYSSAQVWSQPNCPACQQAKQLLHKAGIGYDERMISVNATKQELLALVPDARSVPQIFVDGNYVGGLIELTRLLNDNNQGTTMG